MPAFRGEPAELDTYLEPAVRLTLLVVLVPATVALWWFEAWWWVPVPLLVGMGAHQLFFWSRRDRPTTLEVSDSALVLTDDVRGGPPLEVSLADVHVAKGYRRRAEGVDQVTLLLASAAEPLLAVQVEGTRALPEVPWEVDLDVADRLLGGQAGVKNAVAPLARAARQRFRRPDLLGVIRQHLPEAAWERTGVQLWRGIDPPLSAFGFHVGPAHAWLVLEGSRYSLVRGGERVASAEVATLQASAFRREVPLVVRTEEGPEDVVAEVPCLALRLAEDLRVVFPAPVAAALATSASPREDDYHCHAPEGAALVTHLLRALPADALPEVLRRRA